MRPEIFLDGHRAELFFSRHDQLDDFLYVSPAQSQVGEVGLLSLLVDEAAMRLVWLFVVQLVKLVKNRPLGRLERGN